MVRNRTERNRKVGRKKVELSTAKKKKQTSKQTNKKTGSKRAALRQQVCYLEALHRCDLIDEEVDCRCLVEHEHCSILCLVCVCECVFTSSSSSYSSSTHTHTHRKRKKVRHLRRNLTSTFVYLAHWGSSLFRVEVFVVVAFRLSKKDPFLGWLGGAQFHMYTHTH